MLWVCHSLPLTRIYVAGNTPIFHSCCRNPLRRFLLLCNIFSCCRVLLCAEVLQLYWQPRLIMESFRLEKTFKIMSPAVSLTLIAQIINDWCLKRWEKGWVCLMGWAGAAGAAHGSVQELDVTWQDHLPLFSPGCFALFQSGLVYQNYSVVL